MSPRVAHILTAVLLAGAGTAAAEPAPVPVHHVITHHRRHAQPAPKAAPLASASPAAPPATGPAPVPNEGVSAPVDNSSQESSVAPSVFQLHYPPQGDGYTTGSSSQALDDREAARATGVEVKVPLPQ